MKALAERTRKRTASRLLGRLLAGLLLVGLALPLAACGSGSSRQYMQLFTREDRVYALEADGSLYNLAADGKAVQPEMILPTGDTGGVVAGNRYCYVNGRRLMAYDLLRLTNQVIHEVGADEIASLRLATESQLVFSTARRQDGGFGAFSYYAVDLETGGITPLVGAPFTEGRTLTFLAFFEDRFYFTGPDALKLAAIGRTGGPVLDLSEAVADAPTHACISNGMLFLNAWRKSLHVVSGAAESGAPVVRPMVLPVEIGAPGAMTPFGDGLLICLDDATLSGIVYWLRDINPQTGTGFRLSRVSETDTFISDAWQIVASDSRFHCITNKGKGLSMGPIRQLAR